MKRFVNILMAMMALMSVICIPASSLAATEQIYYLTNGDDGTTVDTGKDTGYSGSTEIKEGNAHFGWTLGSFTMKGYTDVVKDDDGTPIFLVNAGDSIILDF